MQRLRIITLIICIISGILSIGNIILTTNQNRTSELQSVKNDITTLKVITASHNEILLTLIETKNSLLHEIIINYLSAVESTAVLQDSTYLEKIQEIK